MAFPRDSGRCTGNICHSAITQISISVIIFARLEPNERRAGLTRYQVFRCSGTLDLCTWRFRGRGQRDDLCRTTSPSNFRGMSQNCECVCVFARALKPVQFVLQQLHFSCVEGGKKSHILFNWLQDKYRWPMVFSHSSVHKSFFFFYSGTYYVPPLFISPPPAFVLVFASDFASILFFFSMLFYQVRRLTKSTECHFSFFFYGS